MTRKAMLITGLGIIIGAIAGYLYYSYIGCASGTWRPMRSRMPRNPPSTETEWRRRWRRARRAGWNRVQGSRPSRSWRPPAGGPGWSWWKQKSGKILYFNITAAKKYLVSSISEIVKNEPEKTIAIITRTNRDVEHILGILEVQGIQASAERGADIFSHPLERLTCSK